MLLYPTSCSKHAIAKQAGTGKGAIPSSNAPETIQVQCGLRCGTRKSLTLENQ